MLVGPIGVGKTPIAEMISAQLNIEHVMLDMADEYRTAVGWTQEDEYQALSKGRLEQIRFLNQFSARLFKLVMKIHRSAVIDCGGADLVGITRMERRSISVSLKRLGLQHVAAIIPFESMEETRGFLASQGCLNELNEYLLQNPSHRELAGRTFYTRGKRLEIVAKEIIDWLEPQ